MICNLLRVINFFLSAQVCNQTFGRSDIFCCWSPKQRTGSTGSSCHQTQPGKAKVNERAEYFSSGEQLKLYQKLKEKPAFYVYFKQT